MSRASVTLLTALLALALSGAPGASAKAKHHCPKGKKAVGHKCRTIKKAKKKKPATKPPAQAGTPITVTLLDGSTATLTVGDAARTAALTGSFKGFIPGGYMLDRDNTIMLTRGTLAVGATDLLTDDCASPPVAAIDPLTSATLDPAKPSRSTVLRNGDVAASVSVILRTVLDQRTAGCGSPPAQTGYADTPLTTVLRGHIERTTGLARLTLDAAPAPATILACTTLGAPTAPCAAAPVGFPTTIGLHAVVSVRIG